ncbi:unnamed protein product [Schistosoma mattheei]|uniref:Uncharacterized protein n=1 Tax=Schistosoma mattheei TaxID=31246 RepID=A0A183NJI8_9TREM|nr:unnamed protein product [Schistosoma mattheei]
MQFAFSNCELEVGLSSTDASAISGIVERMIENGIAGEYVDGSVFVEWLVLLIWRANSTGPSHTTHDRVDLDSQNMCKTSSRVTPINQCPLTSNNLSPGFNLPSRAMTLSGETHVTNIPSSLASDE